MELDAPQKYRLSVAHVAKYAIEVLLFVAPQKIFFNRPRNTPPSPF
jgi:hypothetical protein